MEDRTDRNLNIVKQVGAAVTSKEIDTYARYREIEDRSYRLRTLVTAWEAQQSEERKLRRSYGRWLLVALCVQTLLVDVAFFLAGTGRLNVPASVANTFMVSVFGQIAALAVVVVRHLFPRTETELLRLLDKA